MGAIDRLAVDLDLNPRGLSLGNGDFDLRDLVLFLLGRRLGSVRISRPIRRLISVFVLVDRFGLLRRLLGRRLGGNGRLGRRLGRRGAAATQEHHDEHNQQQRHGTDAGVNDTRIEPIVLRSTGSAASTTGTTAAASLRHTTAIAIRTAAIATLALKAALTRAGRKFTAALIATLARTRSQGALTIRL